MGLRRGFVACLLVGALVLGISVMSWGADSNTPEASLRSAFPQVQFDKIISSEIPGIYEVYAGPNIFYYYPAKDIIISGEMFGKDLKSITAEHRNAVAAQLVKTLPLEKAVKIGDGKKKVVEFTDPDCPYCRKAAEFFTKRTDVTRYVFFAPLAHPAAINKIQYILGAPNKAEAYDAMMVGQEIPANAKPASEAVKALAQEHLSLAKKVGVQGTPTFFINGQQIVGADTKKIEQLLGPPAPAK
ncbi:DsbC family protein [Geomonas sp. RF6]|uniref:DsbC family protein n=1 Tax=Geomonas sp. RF6 TaxID=2897342 RepID=UPI001E45B340|nr:DsbC family protein [Geomonas sp. RF6]UFS70821.1 DsbC family protein [Geomonas sp. RF6]